MCFFYSTWFRGVTPLDAYTRTHTHHLSNHVSSSHPRSNGCLNTLSPPRPTTLHTPSSSSLSSRGCLARCFISTSDRSVCERERHTPTHTHTESRVYRYGAVDRDCAVYLSFSRPSLSQSLAFFIYFDFVENYGKEECYQRLPPTLLQHVYGAGFCLRVKDEAYQTEALFPVQTSASPSKTLSGGHLLNSLLLNEIKKKTFSYLPLLHPFPPIPKKTAGIGPFGAVLLLSSVCGWSDELGTLWKREEAKRNEGGCVYRNIVTLKKKEKKKTVHEYKI